MPAAVRVGDTTTHGGTVSGPGVATVFICGMPAAVVGDTHVCSLPPQGHPLTVTSFAVGSTKVFAGKRPLLRTGDVCPCGASALLGAPTVTIA